jgi:hypothetical protein
MSGYRDDTPPLEMDEDDPKFFTELYGREDGSWIVVTARCGNMIPPFIGNHRLLCGLDEIFTILYRKWDERKPHSGGVSTQEMIAHRIGTTQQSVSRYANQLAEPDVQRISWSMEELVKFYFETFALSAGR